MARYETPSEGTNWGVFIAPLDIRLPKSTEPDEPRRYGRPTRRFHHARPKKIDARGVRGAPEWLAEVLSPSTARYDEKVKIPVYERAGVPEAWLINFKARTVAIYRLSNGQYGPPTLLSLQGETRITAVPGVTINWDSVVASVRRYLNALPRSISKWKRPG